jgi:hypothetical protein
VTTLLILTSRRDTDDPWQYLRVTLADVVREDLAGVRCGIVCDGDYDGPGIPRGWELFTRKRAAGELAGNKLAYWEALRCGLDVAGDLVVLEDDLMLCRNAGRRMCLFEMPEDLDLVQFFSPFILQGDRPLPGLWRPPPAALLFTQAVKYSTRTLAALVDWQSSPDFRAFNISDQALSVALPRLGLRYGVHSPDLVQHAGALSSITPGDTLEQQNRSSRCWPGREFDALALYGRNDLYQ